MAAITEPFDELTIARMQSFFQTLSEKDQRRYTALEAQRLGHGGISCIAGTLGCSTKTISRGMAELDDLENDPAANRSKRLITTSQAGPMESSFRTASMILFVIAGTSTSAFRMTRPSSPATASSGTGIGSGADVIRMPRLCCCSWIVAAATQRQNIFSSMTCKRLSTRLAWKSAWLTIRVTVRKTIRLSVASFRTWPAPAQA